jgi:hypothetical protein
MIDGSGVDLAGPETRAGMELPISTPLSHSCVASCSTTPLHVGANLQPIDTALFPVLVLSGVASAVLVSLGLFAFVRRQSHSYLLVAKAVLGSLALGKVIPISQHHLVEHALDGLMAVFLLAAVYNARTPPTRHMNTRDHRETGYNSDQSAQSPDARLARLWTVMGDEI